MVCACDMTISDVTDGHRPQIYRLKDWFSGKCLKSTRKVDVHCSCLIDLVFHCNLVFCDLGKLPTGPACFSCVYYAVELVIQHGYGPRVPHASVKKTTVILFNGDVRDIDSDGINIRNIRKWLTSSRKANW